MEAELWSRFGLRLGIFILSGRIKGSELVARFKSRFVSRLSARFGMTNVWLGPDRNKNEI